MPNRGSRLKVALKGTTALAGLFGLALYNVPPALADCDNLTPTTGQTVTCSVAGGTETNSIVTGNVVTDVTINVGADAALSTENDAISMGTGNQRHVITLNGNSTITVTGSNSRGVSLGYASTDNIITLNDAAAINTGTRHSHGIYHAGVSRNDVVTLNGASSISTVGYNASGIYFGLLARNATLALNDTANISTAGSSPGIHLHDPWFSTVTLNDDANISVTGTLGNGIVLGRGSPFSASTVGNTATLNGSASIETNGASGISFDHIPFVNSVALNGTASITTGGDNVSGIFFAEGGTGLFEDRFGGGGDYGNIVTLGAGTSIITTGTNSPAIKDSGGSLTVVSAGLLSSASGVAVDLGDGDDSLTLRDGAQVVGLLDGGGGTDTLRLEGSTGFLGVNYVNFENLTVEAVINDGEWDVTTDLVLTGTSNINQGLLSVNANFTAPTVVVASGGALGGTGTINSVVTIGGSLAPGNSVGTLNVNGAVNFAAGASFDAEVDRTGMDLIAVAGAPGTVTIDPATTVNVIHLDRAEGNAGNIVTATGGIAGSFGTLGRGSNSIAATLVQTANTIRLVTAAPSVFSSQVWAGSEEGFAFLDMLSDEAGAARVRSDARSWAATSYRSSERDGSSGVQSYDQDLFATAVGADLYRKGPVRMGVAVGYTGSDVELGSATGEGDFDSVHGAVYGSYYRGPFFVDAAVSGGIQDGESERMVIVDGATRRAEGNTDGYLIGSSVRVGRTIPLASGWAMMPSAGISYVHRSQDAYNERGGGDAGVRLNSEKSDTARTNLQVKAARPTTMDLGGKTVVLRPWVSAGVTREWTLDDRDITGRFQANGAAFSLHMDARDETMVTFGAGIEAALGDWTAFVAYNGVASKITDRNSVTMGLRKAW